MQLGVARVTRQQALTGWRKLRAQDGGQNLGWSYWKDHWKLDTHRAERSVPNWRGGAFESGQEQMRG